MIFDKRFLASYPYTKEAADYVKLIAPDLAEFETEDLRHLVEGAQRRVATAIKQRKLPATWEAGKDDIEVISYVLAMVIVRLTDNRRLYRIYAEAERKRAEKLLKYDKDANIVRVAKSVLGIDVVRRGREFAIPFWFYVKLSSRVSVPSWRLVNCRLADGYVYVTRARLAKLLAWGIAEKIFNTLQSAPKPRVGRLLEEAAKSVSALVPMGEAVAKVDVKPVGDPPCIKELLGTAARGENITHMGRFLLTTYLLKKGRSIEEIVEVFSKMPDFNMERARYQVEHIAGLRGGRKRYAVPSCTTIKSLNLCPVEGFCHRGRTPATYGRYRVVKAS